MNDPAFQRLVTDRLAGDAYRRLSSPGVAEKVDSAAGLSDTI